MTTKPPKGVIVLYVECRSPHCGLTLNAANTELQLNRFVDEIAAEGWRLAPEGGWMCQRCVAKSRAGISVVSS